MEILQLNILKSLIIILFIILYWKFVYYPLHKKDYTPISFFVVGGILFFVGIYAFFFKKIINFENIKILYSILFIFLVVSFSMVVVGIKKHKLSSDVDITLTWAKRTFPFLPFWFWMIIAFPALFFVMVASNYLLGREHIVPWSMIFLAWVASNLRLYRKKLAK